MLSVSRYAERWPLIAGTGELQASSVQVSYAGSHYDVLLHQRRVSTNQANGDDPVQICSDCKEAFESGKPWLCKYALANDLWIGRWDPLFRDTNLAHQMLLALARIVTTKIVLRPDGSKSSDASANNSWDFLFHQSGMIGTAILFQNADCGEAMQHFPPEKINDSFAVSFVADVNGGSTGQKQADAQAFVASKIAKLRVNRKDFDAQGETLVKTNVVYADKEYRRDLVATWVPDPNSPTVPSVITDAVVAVPVEEESPGQVVAEGNAAFYCDRSFCQVAFWSQCQALAFVSPKPNDSSV